MTGLRAPPSGSCTASPRARASRVRSPFAFTLALALLGACADGGAGCDSTMSCGGFYDYPQSSLTNGVTPVDDSVRFRLTQSGLDFLQERLPALLGGLGDVLAPDPLNPAFLRIELADAIVLNDSPRIALGVDSDGQWSEPTVFWLRRAPLLDELHFELFETEDAIGAHIEDLSIGLDGRLYVSIFGGGEAACEVFGTSTAVCPPEATGGCDSVGLLTTLSFDVLVTPRIGSGAECDDPSLGDCFRLEANVANVTLGDFDSSSLEIDATESCNVNPGSPDCDGECSDTGILDGDGDQECRTTCGAGDFAVDAAAGIAGALEGSLDSFLDDFINDALGDALADIDGMPAQASSRLDIAALVPALGGTPLDLGYLLAPSEQTFDVNCITGTDCATAKGMDIALRTGVEAAPENVILGAEPPHPCVVPLDDVGFTALYGTPQFGAPLDVALSGEHDGAPYHLGLSVARAGVNQALYAAYNTGVLCLETDSEGVHALTNGAFPLSAGTINTLSGGRLAELTPSSSPAVVTVSPSQPPVASFGAGDESQGHLVLHWERVRVSFYVLVYERFARVFAVDVDLSVELTALYDDVDQILELSVSSGPTLENYQQVYSELLPEVAFAEVLEGLLGSLVDQLLGDQLSFELDLGLGGVLSNATGVPIGVEVRGIEASGPSGTRERLNLYFALTDANPSPLVRAALGDVVVQGVSGDLVTLAGAYRRLDDGLEVLARVDGGVWHGPFQSYDGSVEIRHGSLRLPGVHDVELRARPAGSQGAWTSVQVRVPVSAAGVATSAPARVRLLRDGALVRALVNDSGLELAWARDGVWGDFGAERARSLAELEGVRRLSVRARDDDGARSGVVTIDLATKRWRLP